MWSELYEILCEIFTFFNSRANYKKISLYIFIFVIFCIIIFEI